MSHTFVRREIVALEKRGVRIERFSIRPTREVLVDDADRVELRRTRAILSTGVPRLLFLCLRTAFTSPAQFFRAFRLTWKIGWRSDRGMLRNLAYLAEAAVARRWCAELQVQHMHAHFGTNSAAVAMLCHELGGPPYSFTAHGPEEFERGRYLALGDKIAHASFVATVSEYGISQLRQWSGRESWHKLFVVRSILDDAFLSAPACPVPTAPRLVCIARLQPEKGYLVLLQAVARLHADGVGCEVICIGDGPMRAQIESEIARLHLQTQVSLIGWASGAEVRASLLNARALVLPSLAENLPSAILESLCLNRPVISTAIAGIPEMIEPGISGWLVPPGSVDELANAMREALAAPVQQLEAMGRAGAASISRCYRTDVSAQKLLSLLESVARSGGQDASG